MITSSSFNYNESEIRTIKSINPLEKSIEISYPLDYSHKTLTFQTPKQSLDLSSMILLLSRNILIQGDQTFNNHGGHFYLYSTDSNTITAQISSIELRFMGQIKYSDRSAITLRLNGDALDIKLVNLSINDCFARGITFIGGRKVQIINNIISRTYGHGIFFQTGVEMKNIITDNIIVNTFSSWNLWVSDITPAAFYITNLYNNYENNIAIGGEYYGFWIALKNYTDSPFFLMKICPDGIQTLSFKNNAAFSYKIGLYLYPLYIPRTRPCFLYRDDLNMEEPYAINPPIQAIFDGFLAARNFFKGVFLYKIGAVLMKNFQIIKNYRIGLEIRSTEHTVEGKSSLNSSLFIGYLKEKPITREISGLICPKTDGFYLSNLSFFNYDNNDFSACIVTCSGCEEFSELNDAPGGKTLSFSAMSFENVIKKIKFIKTFIDIIQDLDGSLIGNLNETDAGGWVIPYLPHISSTFCQNNSLFDGVICKGRKNFQIRVLSFFDVRPDNYFLNNAIKIMKLNENWTENNETSTFLYAKSQSVNEDGLFTGHSVWTVPVTTGSNYKIYLTKKPVDFEQLTVSVNKYFSENDQKIRILLNFTNGQQKFQITRKNHFDKTEDLIESSNKTSFLNSNTLGSFINGLSNKTLLMSIYKSDSIFSERRIYISRTFCDPNINICSLYNITINNNSNSTNSSNSNDTNNGTIILNNTNSSSIDNSTSDQQINSSERIRLWSEPDTWPMRRIPLLDEDVTIPINLHILIDIDPPNLGILFIEGDLIFDSQRPKTIIKARNIYINKGKLIAGNESFPFLNRIEIILLGNRGSPSLNFASYIPSANKAIIVANQLFLYAKVPNTITSKLTSIALKNQMIITVDECLDWQIGDSILISPSEFDPKEWEERIIDKILQNCTISLSYPLNYNHFGGKSSYFAYNYQNLDMRTRVSLISRNIRISAEDSLENWGCRIIVFKNQLNSVDQNKIVLQGVEIRDSGQESSNFGGLGFEYAISERNTHRIINSSIINSFSHCVKVLNSRNIDFIGNLFINCKDSGILLENSNENINIILNKITGISSSNEIYAKNLDLILTRYRVSGLVINKFSFMPKSLIIQQNEFAGSEGFGALLFGNDCENESSMNKNVFFSNKIGVYMTKNSSNCIRLSEIIAFKNEIGLLGYPSEVLDIHMNNLIFAENMNSLSMNIAFSDENDSTKTSIFLENSTFFGLIREEIPYENWPFSCSNFSAIRMGLATKFGKEILLEDPNDLPIYKPLSSSLFNNQLFFIKNCTFSNYKQEYSKENWLNCSNNCVFLANNFVLDRTMSHLITNTRKVEVSDDSLALFENVYQEKCGNSLCTGFNLALIKDLDGLFIGEKGVLLPKSSNNFSFENSCFELKSSKKCDASYSILTFESMNLTENEQKLFSPVQIFNQDLNFSNFISSYKNYDYFFENSYIPGFYRFSALLPAQRLFELSFPSEPPKSLKIQFENTITEDFLYIKLFYSTRISIKVLANNQIIKPFLSAENSSNYRDLPIDQCGSHLINSDGSFIVLLNSYESCIVKLEVIDSLKISIGFDMTAEEFYKNDGFSLFIDRISKLLGISTDRIRLAGIRKGSVYVDFFIDEEEGSKDLEELKEKLKKKIKSNEFQLMGRQVISIDIEMKNKENYENKTHIIINEKKDEENSGVLIGVAAGVGTVVFVIILIGFVVYAVRRKKKINVKENVKNNTSNMMGLIEKRKKGEFIFDMKSFQTKTSDLELEGVEKIEDLCSNEEKDKEKVDIQYKK